MKFNKKRCLIKLILKTEKIKTLEKKKLNKITKKRGLIEKNLYNQFQIQ